MFGSLRVPITVFQEIIMVACSSLLIVIRYRDLFFVRFRVLRAMELGHSVRHHNLSSGQRARILRDRHLPGLQIFSKWKWHASLESHSGKPWVILIC